MATLKSINPYTGELNAEFETVGEKEIDKYIDAGYDSYKSWSKTDSAYRKELFLKLALVLEEDHEECARLQTIEMGMINHISKNAMLGTVSLIRWFANNFEDILAEKKDTREGMDIIEMYDPIGLIFGVAPWNFPFNQLLRAAVPNILAGNTQIYKHSSNVPLCALKIQELFDKAGFPKGVYQNVFVSSKLSEHIISNPKIAGVNITGSEGAGSAVGSLAGKYLKPSVLELGGNDAFVFLDTKDLDKATDLAVKGRTRNGGQGCNNSKRFIVMENDYEDFCSMFAKKMSDLKLGDPMDESTEIPPLASEKGVDEAVEQINRAIDSGAEVAVGGKRADINGAFLEPTVLKNVTKDTSSFNEEIFAPVASVIKVKDIDEAIDLANSSDFGLSACVYSEDLEKASEVAKKLEGGMIFINDSAASKASLPFGGVKKSGYGKENGPDGLKAFTNKKVIIL